MTERHPAVSRRRAVATIGWSAPAIAAAAAAPAMAASGREVVETVSATKWTGVVKTITIPQNASNVTFEVIGGGGGTYYLENKNQAPYYADRGGSGARITGKIVTQGKPMTLWMVAGGGGYGTTDAGRTSVVATGFGNGGSSSSFYDALLFGAWSNGWCMGGGAGSAIAVGGAPSAGGTLLVAAGGGGAAGLYDHSFRQSTDYSSSNHEGGNGGDAPGGDSSAYVVSFLTGTLHAPGGFGATNGTGGAGGGVGSHTISNADKVTTAPGSKGGDAGTGNFGGGNGAEPIEIRTYTGHLLRTASAAGGGGYAGGGSGGGVHVDSKDSVYGSAGLRRNAIVGTMGGGGAGSNYIAPPTAVTGTQVSSAGNGGTYTTRVGGVGRVTIRYSVPT